MNVREGEGMKRQRLEALLERFQDISVALVGDLFLDRWYEIDPALDEPSLETGRAAHQVVRKRSAPGAGGNVLSTVSALGVGRIHCVSFVGNDGDGWELLEHLRARRVNTDRVIRSGEVVTPVYLKPMFRCGGELVEGERLDVKNFRPTPDALQDALIRNLEAVAEEVDAIILLDQLNEADFGVVTARVRAAAAELAARRPELLIFADSREFIHEFRNVTIKCNNHEALRLTGRAENDPEGLDPQEIFACMDELSERTGRPVFITCNKFGCAVDDDGKRMVETARQSGKIDVCGAGDACTAGTVAALCAGARRAEAAFIGCLASGVTVRKLGQTGTASPQEVLALFDEQWGTKPEA